MKPISLYRRLCSLAAISFVFLTACTEMNDVHSLYLQRGETIYVGKPDSAIIFPGNERARLRFWSSDMKAAKLVIYWRSKTDSLVLDIPPHLPEDSMDVMISNLSETNYSFDLVTMNNDFGNRSIPLQISCNIYGEQFQDALLDRFISTSTLSPELQLEIKWQGAVQKGIGCEVQYVHMNGITMTLYVPMTESTTLIDSVGGAVNYRTLFLPEETAIDTFYTAYRPVSF